MYEPVIKIESSLNDSKSAKSEAAKASPKDEADEDQVKLLSSLSFTSQIY